MQLGDYAKEFRRLSRTASNIPRLLVIWPEENLQLKAREFLADLAKEEGWEFLDLYGIYGNRYDSLGWDGHPSAKTNKRTADVIAGALKAFDLLD